MSIEESAKKIVQMFREHYEGHELGDAYNILAVEAVLRYHRNDMRERAAKEADRWPFPGISKAIRALK